METIGVIAEYNPFHNGHKYMLQQLRDKFPGAAVIVVMSGSYTQRGEAACLSKWQRAACAVQNGADLVLELPFVFTVRSAQFFAEGAVQLLNRLNIVNYLAFGAETDDLILLEHLAALDADRLIPALKCNLQTGISYASALSQAAASALPECASVLQKPNNLLAVEYLRACKKFSFAAKPVLIKREAAPYHSEQINGTVASAQAIRKILFQDKSVEKIMPVIPAATAAVLQNSLATGLPDANAMLRALLGTLRLGTAGQLREIYSVNEGLENLLCRTASAADITTWETFLLKLKSKRYAYARLQRILLYILLHLPREKVELFTKFGPLYARILGFNRTGKKIIATLKKKSGLPMVNRPAKFMKASEYQSSPLIEMLSWDFKATELRNLCLPQIPARAEDLTRPPIYVNC